MTKDEDPLRGRVLEALGKIGRPAKTKEIAKRLDVPTHEYRDLKRLLASLERSGKVIRTRGNRYAVPASMDVVPGTVSMTRRGDGFVRPAEGGEDVFVPAAWLDTAMDGDRVAVRVERHPKGRNREGRVIRVLDRARDSVVGTLHRGKKITYVTPLDARLNRDLLIAPDEDAGAAEGDVVVVRILTYGEGRVGPTGSVERVLGPLSDPGVDVLAVAYGFGVSLDFPKPVLDAAQAAAREGLANPGGGRVDRTGLLCFTIDPADAKDHDDALSATRTDDGMVEIGVHIADVSHFVRRGSKVDAEAFDRGTSVYLVDRTVPMLPPVLSNEVCSLNPDEDRFAMSVYIVLSSDGAVQRRRYERTTIRCRRGLSYEEAQAVLEGNPSGDPEVDEALRILDDHAKAVRKRRNDRGSLDLDLPEAKVILGEDGVPTDIKMRERKEAHRLVEDFMILANEVVAEDMESRSSPALFRVHEPPSREKVEELGELLERFGLPVPKRKTLRPRDAQRLLEAVKGRAEETLVSTAVLRSLTKARYDPENLGHFGLASQAYLHFTSPIRRYPDLIVHRAVADAFLDGPSARMEADALEAAAERTSARERAAEEAERASVAMKKVEFMERHLGEKFAGRISGVTAFGFFVTLEEFFVDGLVHVSGLSDDYYRFDERAYTLVGERKGRRYRLGDRLEVQVSRVDKEARHIDFVPVRSLPRAD
ncbi:MAG: ribonuclease R [Gemmatimonadota bacterium]